MLLFLLNVGVIRRTYLRFQRFSSRLPQEIEMDLSSLELYPEYEMRRYRKVLVWPLWVCVCFSLPVTTTSDPYGTNRTLLLQHHCHLHHNLPMSMRWMSLKKKINWIGYPYLSLSQADLIISHLELEFMNVFWNKYFVINVKNKLKVKNKLWDLVHNFSTHNAIGVCIHIYN